jgi:DNA primase
LDPNSPESQVLQLATQAYEEQLWRGARARAYLEARGVPEQVARAQRLGYADGNALLQRLGPEDREVAQRVGLVLERPPEWTTGPRFREFLADRIIVPELRGGRPIWLIGRAIGEPSTVCGSGTPADTVPRRRGRPKYLSLPGERPVLGLEQVVGRKVVYVVEGPFDWLAAISWSLPAFAMCGTHFPIERLPSLDSAVAVYGVFDPDRAGRSAAERLAPLIGSRWRPVHLPNGLDVAELALLGEQGRETFQVLVGRARALAWQDDRV